MMEATMRRNGVEGRGAWGCLMGVLVLVLVVMPVPMHSQGSVVPDLLPYQGTLVNGDGVPLGTPNPKNYELVFRIYDDSSGGALVWSEQQTVTVDGGRYAVKLGAGGGLQSEPRPALWTVFQSSTASSRFLEVTVKGIGFGGTDSTLDPRARLLPAPYAWVSRHAMGAEAILNSSGRSAVSIRGTRVGINTTNPATALHVVGTARSGSLEVVRNARVNGVATAASWSGNGAAPVGSIIMWSGSAAERPDGWALCDGGVVNGYKTPDLRGRFVVGAGAGPGLTERRVGDMGGAEAHELVEAELPTHGHWMSAASVTVHSSGEHSHSFWGESGGGSANVYGINASANMTRGWASTAPSGSTAGHAHSFNLPPTRSSASGGNGAHPNMPPFYVLAYLVRVQ